MSAEKEALRQRFVSALRTTAFPPRLAIERIGCSRLTYYNWMGEGEISDAYLDKVQALTEVLEMCNALGALPLPDRKVDTPYVVFFAAMEKLRQSLAEARNTA
jgi:hypothetical protein